MSWKRIREELERRGWLLAGVVVMLGFFLRASGFDDYWLNPDEGIFYSVATRATFAEAWEEISGNAHPPPYFLLLRVMGLISVELAWLRLPALVSGCLAILGCYLLGRELAGVGTGVIAALLMAVSPAAIVQSQLIRPYMMQVAILVFGLFFLVRHLRGGRDKDLVVYAILMPLAVLIHYSSVLAAVAVGCVLTGVVLKRKIRGRELRMLGLAHVPVLLVIVCIYFFHLAPHVMGSQMHEEAMQRFARFMIKDLGDVWERLLGLMRYLFYPETEIDARRNEYTGPAVLLLLAGIGVALVRRKHLVHAFALGALGVAIVVAALQRYPFGCSRHSMYLAAFLVVPMAYPIAVTLSRGPGATFLLAMAGAFLLISPKQVNALTGADRLTALPAFERITMKEDMVALEPFFRSVEATPGLVLVNLQTYYCLLPYFREARVGMEWQGDPPFLHFRWGRREVLVNFIWEMRADLHEIESRMHLLPFLANVNGALPEMNSLGRTSAWMFFGGWTMPLARQLYLIDQDLPPQRRLIMAAAPSIRGIRGFVAYHVNLEGFADLVEALVAQRKQGSGR